MDSIPQNTLIRKFIHNQKLEVIYSRIIIKHIVSFLTAMAIKGYTAKMTDITEVSKCHRTTLSYFISKSPWDEKPLVELIRTQSYQHVEQLVRENAKPLFVSFDDTVNPKTKPSSRAKRPIQGTSFHHSHLLGKSVWGHQVQATMVSNGDTALIYDVHRYDKQNQSKIEYAVELIKNLPEPGVKSYFLADRWYANGKIINACIASGYHFIGALKANRIIYPQGIRINIADFARYIEMNDVDLVTVNDKQYYVYRYEGKLNDIENAVVCISWPIDSFKNSKSLRAFISTDVSLETSEILDYYANRWCIETFFAQSKGCIGFGKYQIRSVKGIERLWLLTALFHLLSTIGLGSSFPFSDGLRLLRKDISEDVVAFIYHSAQRNIPLEDVIKICA